MTEVNIDYQCRRDKCQKTVRYRPNPKHRNQTPGKSQWTISPEEEVQTFRYACQDNWILEIYGWGLHLTDGAIAYLGVGRERQAVFIAKFDGCTDNEWHGYPCDYRQDNQCPPGAILRRWLSADLISRAMMRKISKGQRCVL